MHPPVYNIEVEGDHCYRVGEQGILVHNASCPKQTTVTPLGSDLVPVSWYDQKIPRAKGVMGMIVSGTAGQPPFASNFPDWWTLFTLGRTEKMISRLQ